MSHAEIRERHGNALEGPYEPVWDSSDGVDDRLVYALRLPVPHTKNHVGEPSPWEFLYSELGQFPPETVLFFAHAHEDMRDLFGELDRLTSACMAAELERDARLPAADVERFLKRERDEHDKGSLAWRDLDGVLDCFRLHMVTGTPLTEPRPEEGPGDPSVGRPSLTETEELRDEVDRLTAENVALRQKIAEMEGGL